MPIKAQMKHYDNKVGKAMTDYANRTSPKKEAPAAKPSAAPAAKAVGSASKAAPAKYGEGDAKTKASPKGIDKANVSAAQLKKSGMSLRQYMNTWNKTGSRPTGKK